MSDNNTTETNWRRRMVDAGAGADYPAEGREWLPMVLAGLFLALVLAAGLYLLLAGEEDELSAEEARVISEREAELPAPRSTSEERSRWEAALEADTVLAYRRFIEDFPESVFLGQAQVQLDVLDQRLWAELSAEDTAPAYEDYLEQFPDGLHQAEALTRLDEIARAANQAEREALERERRDNQAWTTARTAGTLAAVESYINAWPTGLHIEEAQSLRRMLKAGAEDSAAFASAQSLGTRDAYQAYIDAFPRGDHVTDALAAMDDLVMRPGRRFRDCEQCPEMVVVPAGSYVQGSSSEAPTALSNERPERTVTLSENFAVGVTEVTFAQWDACHEAGGCEAISEDNGWGRGARPVIMVSWNQAQAYIQWLNETTGKSYRLPSESEWEYFARAGTEGDWLGGSEAAVCAFGNIAGAESGFDWRHSACSDPVPVGTAPVASLEPNAFGLYDVIGNVAEWAADCMNLSYLDAPSDGSAWGRGICSSHMTRGGSWLTGTRDIRLPARFNLKNGDSNDFTGLRVVRRIDER